MQMDESELARLFINREYCPLCSSRSYAVHVDFLDIPVRECSECRFIYSGLILRPDRINDYYQNNFGSLRHMQGQVVNAKANLVALSKFIDLLTVSSILDIGTGYGFLLKALQDKYHIKKIEGVEPSRQEAKYAIENLNLRVFPGLLRDAGLTKESFDVVTCFEVIEHVPKPIEFLSELALYVKPGGKMVIMTDNFGSWPCRVLGPEFPKWIPHTHVSHFTPSTLVRCIESVAGLHVKQFLSYTPPELTARIVLIYIVTKSPPPNALIWKRR